MPSKSRWALNPRKWFGAISKAAHKRDQKSDINNAMTTSRAIPSTSTTPHLLPARSKTKVLPINDNNHTSSTTTVLSFTNFQLPAFNARREKTSTFLTPSSTLFNRANTFVPTRLEPSIRKNGQYSEHLAVDATRCPTQTTVSDTSKVLLSPSLSSQYGNLSQQIATINQSEINMSSLSAQCLVDYPQNSSTNFIEKCPSPARTSSSLSIDDNDQSSSSGVFTDERTDLNDQYRTASKDTLSTLDVLSIDSIVDSQTSLNHCESRPMVHRYRLPMPTFARIDNKPVQLQRETPIIRFQRAHSAEGILKDNQISSPIITKTRQSSAAIVKKIERRIPTSRSPPITLEKAGFVRIANDTYRLTADKDNHLYRRERKNSVIQYSTFDDSLPPANDEESYARLPRTSSTEQLNNNNIQNDVRAMVDDYLRPMVSSLNKTTYRSTKAHHRSKRFQTNNENVQITIEHITDKLLSSIDCSTYEQYQRSY
jgi:hypothetical protein